MNSSHYKHITDQQLLEHFYNDRDNQWLGILLQRYTLLLLGVCMKYLKNEAEAKDAVQQIFLKVLMELPKYQVTYFKSWIYMVTKNHCLMKIRNAKGKIPVELSEQFIAQPDDKKDTETMVQEELTLDIMELALKELNPRQQQCIILFYLQKKSYQEISDLSGFSMTQVKSFIQNGKRNLKIIIEKKLKEENIKRTE